MEDDQTKKIFNKAIQALFIRINGRRTAGVLNLGWGKKLGWGTFEAKMSPWQDTPLRESDQRTLGFLQAPLTSAKGSIHMLQPVKNINALSKTIKVRNIHHKYPFSSPTVYVEGSEVLVENVTNFYQTDNPDWLIGFGYPYNRIIAGKRIKALEAAILFHKKTGR
ncbi:MAG: hypothetical protein GF308_16010 [Candidatus Heimdallarchaeota archaeon]|nr:hypothetical protein [Candidatus Heimdallarchaeota archaeon]